MTSQDFQSRLLDAMPAIIWSASAATYQFTYVRSSSRCRGAGARTILEKKLASDLVM